MPQVREAEIGKPCPLDRIWSRRIAESALDGFAAIRTAQARILPSFPLQHSDRLSVQRDASRRSILGAVQPHGFRST